MSNDKAPDREPTVPDGKTSDEIKLDRREFVKRCGKYSLYVAPLVATLLESKGAKAQSFTVG